MIDSLRHDVRFAWRGLVRSPGFAAIAIATLALGIGANSAIFTIVNAVVMRPLPYPEPDCLVRVTSDFTGLGSTDLGLSQPELTDYRDRSGIFEALAGVWALNANLTEVDEPERVEVLIASPSYFDILGARPQLGRLFRPDDEGPGITEVLVISDALWRRRFAASPSAIGRKLKIDQDWYTVIGVLPPEFRPSGAIGADRACDAWAPTSFMASRFRSSRSGCELLHHRSDRQAEAGDRRERGSPAAGGGGPGIPRGLPEHLSGARRIGTRGSCRCRRI